MNIVLDGISGVGKTYYGNLLARKLGISFLTFSPNPNEVDEPSLHEYVIARQCKYHAPILVEGSVLMSEFTKMWMYQTGHLTLTELMSILETDKSKVAPYGIIYLVDLPENVQTKRVKRGRPYEYFPTLKDLSSIDKFITNKYIDYATAHQIPLVTVSVTKKTDDEVIAELEHAIYRLITE